MRGFLPPIFLNCTILVQFRKILLEISRLEKNNFTEVFFGDNLLFFEPHCWKVSKYYFETFVTTFSSVAVWLMAPTDCKC